MPTNLPHIAPSSMLLISSLFFFCLFLLEIFFLRPSSWSLSGNMEQYSLYLAFILGFLSFRKAFFIGCSTFIFLSMLPMMIPFLMLFQFVSIPNSLPIDTQHYLRDTPLFGQVPNDLALFQKQNFLLDKKLLQFNCGLANINDIQQISAIQLSQGILSLKSDSSLLSINYTTNQITIDGETIPFTLSAPNRLDLAY